MHYPSHDTYLGCGTGPGGQPSCKPEVESGAIGTPSASFLNISQGDAAPVITPGGRLLSSTAGTPNVVLTPIACLGSKGIEKIDWVMPSHPNADHFGGLNTAL